jgi:hypothetical protein
MYVQSKAHYAHFGPRSYFNVISANIELQVYSVACCEPYVKCLKPLYRDRPMEYYGCSLLSMFTVICIYLASYIK